MTFLLLEISRQTGLPVDEFLPADLAAACSILAWFDFVTSLLTPAHVHANHRRTCSKLIARSVVPFGHSLNDEDFTRETVRMRSGRLAACARRHLSDEHFGARSQKVPC